MVPSTRKKLLPQQVARSKLPNPTRFKFHVITERRKRVLITGAISFTENLI